MSKTPQRRILRVDLSKGSFKAEDIPENLILKFLGGKGLAAHYAFNEIKAGTDALSEDNKLILFVGALTGIFPAFTRYVAASKSPLTEIFCDSYAGGRFGQELAKTGFLGIIIEGKSPRRSFIRIDGDSFSIEDSSILSGKNPYEMCDALKPLSAMVIGEAGRNLVKYACIMNDLTGPGRAGVLGRGGLGAVMGSKNLDAVAIKGKLLDKELIPPGRAEAVRNNYLKAFEYIKKYVVKGMDLGGNLPAVELCEGAKVLPVSNFTKGSSEDWENLAIPTIKKFTIKKHTCPLCPLACGVHVKMGEDEVERIEYETVALCGFNCNHTDFRTVLRLCKLCNELGMDTMSAGVVAAFAMECTERGIHDFGVKFGDSAKHEELLRRISARKGDGDLLAEGVRCASRGVNAEELALQIKGLEFPGYDPRGVVGMSLAYATSDRGADHLRAWTITSELKEPFTIEGKAHLTKYLQDRNAALWTLICCDNIPANTIGDPEEWIDITVSMINSIGIDMDKIEFLNIGERIYNLTRLFNTREGISRKDDRLPKRMHELRNDTGWAITRADFESLLDSYYQLRGWDNDGVPTKETLKRLGLDQGN